MSVCPSLKRKSCLSAVSVGPDQTSAPHSSLAPAHYNGHPRVLTLTSGLGKVECGERGAVPATALFGHNMWTGQRDWGQAGMSWLCVHCYLWPGLAWAWAVMGGCHVTWHGAWQGIEHRQSWWYLLHLSPGPSLWYSVVHQSSSPAPAGWAPLSSANHSPGSPQTANESSCREFALIWKLELEWVSHGLSCWDQWQCRLQEALLSVAGAGPGAGWRFYMLAGPISQTLTRQRTSRQWTLWQQFT